MYSHNSRMLWCFREAAVIAVQVRVDPIDYVFLHGLITRTDGLSVVLSPPSVCKTCGEEFVNLTRMHNHNCQRRLNLPCRQFILVGFLHGFACCLWTHSAISL